MISLYISFILGIIVGSLDLYLPGFLACLFFIKDHKKEVGIFLLALIIYFIFNPLIGEVDLPDKEERQNLVIKDIYEQGDKNFYLMEWERSPFNKYVFKSEERAEDIAGKIKRAANAKSLKNDIKDYLGYKISIKGEFLLFDKGGLAGEFDREKFYAGRGISGRLKINEINDVKPAYSINRFFYSLGRGLERQIDKMPKEQAAFLKRLILAKTTEDETLQNKMKSLGLNHLLAASGLHVNLIFFLLLNLMAFLPLDRKKISITIIILLFIYGKIIRNPPSIMRAIYFCIFREWALITRRKISSVKMILLSLCLVVLPAPYRIRDKGLQLSFACVWAIEMKKSLEMDSFKEETFFDKLKTSFWISLMTLPILSSMSTSISISSIFINPLVIPIFSKVFLTGLISLTFISFPLIGGLINKIFGLSYLLFTLLVEGLTIFAAGERPLYLRSQEIILYYGLLVVFYLLKTGKIRALIMKYYGPDIIYRDFRKLFKERFKLIFIWAICLIYLPCLYIKSQPSFMALDVGQGDAFLLSAGGGNILFDCGGRQDFKSRKNIQGENLYFELKELGVDKLDAVFISHRHYDHMGNLEILAGLMPISEIYISPSRKAGADNKRDLSIKNIEGREIAVKMVKNNKVYTVGAKGFLWKIFNKAPTIMVVEEGVWDGTDPNQESMILYLDMGIKILLTGDREKNINNCPQQIDLLKVAHHGSAKGSGIDFLQGKNIERALISAGRNNSYKHPDKKLLSRLREAGIPYDRTDLSGSLVYYPYKSDFLSLKKGRKFIVFNKKKIRIYFAFYLLFSLLILLMANKISLLILKGKETWNNF